MAEFKDVDELGEFLRKEYPDEQGPFKPEEIQYYGQRVRRVVIAGELILEWLAQIGSKGFSPTGRRIIPVNDIIPLDTKLVGLTASISMNVTLFIEHESFDVFDDLSGRQPPIMTPSFRCEYVEP